MSIRTIQNIFRSCENQLAQTPQSLKNRKAIYAISHCRTPDMGLSTFSCPDRHETVEHYHSCRNRSCYLCSLKTKLDWVEKQKTRLLNIPHFHVVFTLPHEYLSLWRFNEALFARLLFKASQETLLSLLEDAKYHGVKPGILAALHTWGRQLRLHPHIHCLVTAGGITIEDEWKQSGDFLLPIRVVKSLYRGKLQAFIREAFENDELVLPPDMTERDFWLTYRSLYQKDWSARIEERYEHGKGVMLYLSRYLKGGPIHPNQISQQDETQLSFRYLDHRDKRRKWLSLSPMELVSRLLQHVPPSGVHRVRYYGIYAASSKVKHQEIWKALGTLAGESTQTVGFSDLLKCCKVCSAPLKLISQTWGGAKKAISINKERQLQDRLQQVDHVDVANVSVRSSPLFSSA